jgi:hypothetical protein
MTCNLIEQSDLFFVFIEVDNVWQVFKRSTAPEFFIHSEFWEKFTVNFIGKNNKLRRYGFFRENFQQEFMLSFLIYI